jgi:uncharacterized membrane protein YgcG
MAKIDVPDDLHRALSMAAALRGVTVKDLADSIMRPAIDSEIWELMDQRSSGPKVKVTEVRKYKSPDVPKEKKDVSTEVQNDPVEAAKAFILAELEAGREPRGAAAAAAGGGGANRRGGGFGGGGGGGRRGPRGGKKARRYTLDMKEKIEKKS